MMNMNNISSQGQQIFNCIMGLYNAGVSMVEIEGMLPEILAVKEQKSQEMQYNQMNHNGVQTMNSYDPVEMAVVMERVLQNNNVMLEQGISHMVTDSIKEELSCIFVARDQIEEERYRCLDSLIRQQQVYRKETAKRGSGFFMKEILGFS